MMSERNKFNFKQVSLLDIQSDVRWTWQTQVNSCQMCSHGGETFFLHNGLCLTYALRGRQADGSGQQQDKGQGLAQSQRPRHKERNKQMPVLVTSPCTGRQKPTKQTKCVHVVRAEETEKETQNKQKGETRLTLQTKGAFRSMIISTNKLLNYHDPLWTRAKVRNASRPATIINPPFHFHHPEAGGGAAHLTEPPPSTSWPPLHEKT